MVFYLNDRIFPKDLHPHFFPKNFSYFRFQFYFRGVKKWGAKILYI